MKKSKIQNDDETTLEQSESNYSTEPLDQKVEQIYSKISDLNRIRVSLEQQEKFEEITQAYSELEHLEKLFKKFSIRAIT